MFENYKDNLQNIQKIYKSLHKIGHEITTIQHAKSIGWIFPYLMMIATYVDIGNIPTIRNLDIRLPKSRFGIYYRKGKQSNVSVQSCVYSLKWFSNLRENALKYFTNDSMSRNDL